MKWSDDMTRALIFDFDGTLFDTGEGIIRSVQYALERFGIHETDTEKLRKFVGPPLVDSFMELYGMPLEQAKEAVARYRERYVPVGLLECAPYPGMLELLEKLRAAGFRLAVATGKPTAMAEQILTNHGMERVFDCVYGSEPDGLRAKKEEAILAALQTLGLTGGKKREALMIGDRKCDAEGALNCGIDCVGVYYGYAEPGEMERAGAVATVNTVAELEQYLLQLN